MGAKDKLEDAEFIADAKAAIEAVKQGEHEEFTEAERKGVAETLKAAVAILLASPEMATLMGLLSGHLMMKHGFPVESAIKLVADLHVQALRDTADDLATQDPLKHLPKELRTVVN